MNARHTLVAMITAVAAITALPGCAVSRGQSLYSLDAAPFKAALDKADADVASAEARLAQASRTLARLKPLFEARAVSQKEYDDAASAEAIARADVKGAQARRAEAIGRRGRVGGKLRQGQRIGLVATPGPLTTEEWVISRHQQQMDVYRQREKIRRLLTCNGRQVRSGQLRSGELGASNAAKELVSLLIDELHRITVHQRHPGGVVDQDVALLEVADHRVDMVDRLHCQAQIRGHVDEMRPADIRSPLRR